MFRVKLAAAAAMTVALCSNALAFTNTANGTAFQVQMTVTAACTITADVAGPITFTSTANSSPTPPADVPSTVSVNCPAATPYAVYFTSVNTVTSNTERTMKNGASTIGYEILRASDSAKIGNAFASGLSGTGNGSAQATGLLFHIPAAGWATGLTPGTYSDTVTLQVDY